MRKAITCLDHEGTWESAWASFIVLIPEKQFRRYDPDSLTDASGRFIADDPKAQVLEISDLIQLARRVKRQRLNVPSGLKRLMKEV
jgi:hypothetical protein